MYLLSLADTHIRGDTHITGLAVPSGRQTGDWKQLRQEARGESSAGLCLLELSWDGWLSEEHGSCLPTSLSGTLFLKANLDLMPHLLAPSGERTSLMVRRAQVPLFLPSLLT